MQLFEFARSLTKVLVQEGGYSNPPQDPGGATIEGVTERVHDEYRRSIGASPPGVKEHQQHRAAGDLSQAVVESR
ncbi:hypothetical protein J5277_11920 [Rhizobium sp. 16-449-1b]|uniref:glycosyl hydrolase 108 family protein n=1 Tax=Rhizobium sp. 16-449-1b TaxID=2819989 RepID=UPI001ADB4B1E|nr:glycosyl hydrolase 108 family protein [Rhizobium sp. 16-449-1b]MBO9194816.1 hypothetical protein [Rhizobium sp. 16-449-1b]